jgi:flagellar hook-associated protein 1
MAGLNSIFNSALSGLNVTQAGIDVVSNNVANAGSIGYTRRSVSAQQIVANGQTVGARTAGIQRSMDLLLQKQLRMETSGAAYTDAKANVHTALDQLFGTPGGVSALDTGYNRFQSSLQQLVNDPSSYTLRGEVLSSASRFADQLRALSDNVQTLRKDAEQRIGIGVRQINEFLGQLKTINTQLGGGGSDGLPSPALLDERDRILSDLSRLVDLRVTEGSRGQVSVYTTGGLQLFDNGAATSLSFDERGFLSPESLYNTDPSKRGVGTITATDANGGNLDLIANDMIRSGELAAYIEVRDKTLVEAQTQLDELAANLARTLSDKAVTGVAATSGAASGFDVDLTGLQQGNEITINAMLTPSGVAQKIILKRVDDASQLPLPSSASADPTATIFGIDFSGGVGAAVAQIQAALGGGYAVSNPAGSTLRILDDGAAGTRDITSLGAAITTTSLASGGIELPFFVDGGNGNALFTGSFEGGSQLVGFSQRVAVNPALLADRSKLVVYNLVPPNVTPQGDTARPQALLDRLSTASRIFSAQSGIGGLSSAYQGTIADFVRRVVDTQGAASENATRLNEGQKTVLSVLESKFSSSAGVNVDEELSRLIQLQAAYSANARVISAAKELMDALIRI